MANNEEMTTSILINAKTDEQQIRKEVDKAGNIIQQENSKKRTKIVVQADIKDAQEKFDRLSLEYKELKRTAAKPVVLEAKAKEMKEANDQIVSLKKELKGMDAAANTAGNAIQGLITKFAGFFAITKIFSFLINTFNDFQKAQKELVMATGASGDALRDLENSLADVQGNVGQSSQEVAQAIGELNTRLGLTGQELTDFTTKYLNFATVTGQDGKTAIADNVKMFSQWWIATQKQGDYLDKLAKAWQLTGINVSNLTSQLQQNQIVLSEMGFTLDQSIALLSNFEKAGIEAGDALAAMKVGIANLVDKGYSPAEALSKIVDQITNAKTETEAMDIAFNTFGKRGGLAMFNAIKNGTLDINEMAKSLENAKWTVDDTYKSMETFWEFISRKRNGYVSSFVQRNNEGFQSMRQLINIIGESLQPAINNANNAWESAKDYMGDAWTTIKQVYNWERDLTLALTEKGVKMEADRKKTKELEEINNEYANTLNDANKALNTFNATAINDAATREEFEADRKAALDAAEWFKAALQEKILYTKGQMVGLPMVSAEYVKLSKDLSVLTTQAINAEAIMNRLNNAVYSPKKASGGGSNTKTSSTGGSSGGSKSNAVENKKEELKALRDLRIQEVQESVASEKEKNEKLLEIYNWYQKELVKIEGKTNDELLKSAEQYVKDYYDRMQKASENEQKAATDSINKAKKYQDQIKKLGDQWEEYKDKAIKNIREVNNSLEELEKEFNQNISERYNEVQDTIKKFERENGNVDWLKSYDVESLKNYGSEEISGIKVDDAIEYIEALKEQEILNSRLNDQQKELAKTLERQSESEKLIKEYEEKRAALVEQKGIYEAVANQGTLDAIGKKAIELEDDIVKYYDATKDQYVEITDFKNQELARDLLNQQTKLETEYTQQQTALNNELDLVKDHSEKVLAQRQSDTKAYKKELDNRLDAVKSYVYSVQDLLSSVPDSYRAYGGELNKGVTMVGENWPEAIVRRQASYVQPRNAANTYSTVNNTNSLSINGLEVWNFNSIDDLLGELRNRLTYRN